MTTKTTDRTTSADLAARLRERAAEYEEAGREKLRCESALLAAFANYERARYRERGAREEWRARARGLAVFESGDGAAHLARPSAFGFPSGDALCGVADLEPMGDYGPTLPDCPACLAALDEVQP
jgi:hypothetical protein